MKEDAKPEVIVTTREELRQIVSDAVRAAIHAQPTSTDREVFTCADW